MTSSGSSSSSRTDADANAFLGLGGGMSGIGGVGGLDPLLLLVAKKWAWWPQLPVPGGVAEQYPGDGSE